MPYKCMDPYSWGQVRIDSELKPSMPIYAI